jgi:hypothetical protein
MKTTEIVVGKTNSHLLKLLALLSLILLSGCATKNGRPCFVWQKDTDIKQAHSLDHYFETNAAAEDEASADTIIRLQGQIRTNGIGFTPQ